MTGRHRRSTPTSTIVRVWEQVAPAARTSRDIAQPIFWFFVVKDEAASTIEIVLAAFADCVKTLFDFAL